MEAVTRTSWGSIERRHIRDADYTGPDRRHNRTTDRQFDYLADQLATMEGNMIDPRDFGRLESEVKSLQAQVMSLSEDVKQLLELANQSRGGMWVGMGMASMVGGLVSWIAGHWK